MMGHDYAHCEDYDEATCPQICFRGQLVRDYRDRVHTDMQGVPVSWMHLRGTTECQLYKPKRTCGDRVRAMTDRELAEWIVRKTSGFGFNGYEDEVNAWYEWLKSEVQE